MAEVEQTGMQLASTGTVAGGGGGGATAVLGRMRRWLAVMHPAKRRQLGSAVLFGGAVIAILFWYANRPDWRPLYSGLESKDLQLVAQELSAANIPYQMTEDGSGIQVGADQMDRARMEVATKGMPQTGRMGFEIFDKPNWVGSEFDEKVNYQRALEGELEHTISTLAVVRSARVHLVLPKDVQFGDAPQQAKASVVLQLRHSALPPEQVEAIRSLVAGAVENLAPSDVALVDAEGKLNLASPNQDQIAGDEERSLEEKLTAMLEPVAGAGNVRATVNVSYDQGSQEKTDEVYDPTQVAALTMHRIEQSSGDTKPRAGGVPGTASNTPGATSITGTQNAKGSAVPPLLQTSASTSSSNSAQNPLPVYPLGNPPTGETVTDENGTYAVTRHLLHSEEGPGRIRRVTAAIVVNDRMMTENSGKQTHTAWKPRTPDEMQRLQQLARAAVGFDATRGDEVLVENIGFSSNQPEVPPTALGKVVDQADGLLRTQPGLLRTISFSLIGLLVVLAVLKPISRQISTSLNQVPAALTASTDEKAMSGQTGNSIPLGALPSSTHGADAQALYRQIAEQVRKEPAQSARVIESWINARAEEVG